MKTFWLWIWWLVAVVAFNSTRIRPPRPLLDEFYTPPDGYEKAAPGDILRIRPTPHNLRNIYFAIDVQNAWQVLVRSTDQFGQPAAVVTTVIEPYNSDLTKIVSYHMFVDSSSEDCAPSYAMLEGASMMTLSSQLEVLFIQLCLEKGWTVSIPDHGGVSNQFPGGPQSGYAALDSIRGVLKSGEHTGIKSDAEVVLWGYSGGLIPTMWLSIIQPKYAPELKSNLLGAAAGGCISNLTSAAMQNDGTPSAGLIAIAMGGFAKTYPQFDALLKQRMSPQHYDRMISAQNRCFFPNMLLYVGTLFFSGKNPWVEGGLDLFENEIVKQIFAENSIPTNLTSPVPEIPMLIYHGYHDELLPHKDLSNIVDFWCERGIGSLEFMSDYTSDHLIGVVSGVPLAITWIAERFAGKEPVEGCSSMSKINFLRYPGATKETWESLVRTGGHYFGRNIGSTTQLSIDFALRFFQNTLRKRSTLATFMTSTVLSKFFDGDENE